MERFNKSSAISVSFSYSSSASMNKYMFEEHDCCIISRNMFSSSGWVQARTDSVFSFDLYLSRRKLKNAGCCRRICHNKDLNIHRSDFVMILELKSKKKEAITLGLEGLVGAAKSPDKGHWDSR